MRDAHEIWPFFLLPVQAQIFNHGEAHAHSAVF
jgi:hypothetical protein